jgi:hypothetical protein
MRARVQLSFAETPGFAIKRFRAEIDKHGEAVRPAMSTASRWH